MMRPPPTPGPSALHSGIWGPFTMALVVYLDPSDFRGWLVVRGWTIGPGWVAPHPEPWVLPPRMIERIRQVFAAEGWVRARLPEGHDPTILEEWLPAPALWGRDE